MSAARATDLLDVSIEDLEAWLLARGEPPYRARQILGWVHARDARSFEAMTDVGKALRRALEAEFSIGDLEPRVVETSSDGTQKLLFEVPGARPGRVARIESVLIPKAHEDGRDGGRLTLCLSSQAGCGMGCAFCATATLGLERSLGASEIVGQVRAARRVADPKPLTNLVFMGMGEPLANWPAVRRAIRILTADWGHGMSKRRVTVSTVGLAPMIPTVVEETGVHLAISLHATTDEQRARLIPVASRYSLEDLLGACRRVPLVRRSRITFEYVLLAGENDGPEDARRLTRLLHGIRSKVNLIRFNPFPGARFSPSPRGRVEAFQRALLAGGLATTVRESRGADIQAACGQLAAGRRAA
jgi:23S rRNA (adenine2503-C2)-methyltransferase